MNYWRWWARASVKFLRRMGLIIHEDELLTCEKVVRHDPKLLADAVYRMYEIWKASHKPMSAAVSAESI